MKIGEIDLIPLNDGVCKLPQDFYVGLDFAAHAELLDEDGTVHIPVGCFLVKYQETTILVDAGLGAVDDGWATGGELPAARRAAGTSPADIDIVVCTHLHIDHIGWLAVDDEPFFPNAVVRYGADDWGQFVAGAKESSRGRRMMEVLAEADRLDPLEGDMVRIAPGVTGRHMPGHTLGHYGLVISSGDARAMLLGDAVECPLQLEEPDFYAMSDVDPKLSARTREALCRELEGSDTVVTGAHFPGLEFGRVLAGTGAHYFATGR